jgi:hypothetical protein
MDSVQEFDPLKHYRNKKEPLSTALTPIKIKQPKYTKYRLKPTQQELLREIQGNKCAICGCKSRLRLDHDHKTNQARGYLCHSCNRDIVILDKPDKLAKAMAYLAKPPAKRFY